MPHIKHASYFLKLWQTLAWCGGCFTFKIGGPVVDESQSRPAAMKMPLKVFDSILFHELVKESQLKWCHIIWVC
jgi:hypothetical protein